MATPSPVSAETAPAAPFDAQFLLNMIACDAHWCAMDVATLAMLVVASSRPGARGDVRACRHLLRDDAKAMGLALRYGEEVGLSVEDVDRIGALYKGVAAAQAQLLPLTKLAALSDSQRQQLRGLSGAWRRLAAEAAEALSRLEGAMTPPLHRDHAEDAETLRQYLKRAAEGDARDVDAFGVIALPALKQRFRAAG